MSSNTPTEPTLASLQADIAALKHDLSSLLGHLKSGGTRATTEPLQEEAQRLYQAAAAQGSKATDALSEQIEKQPLMALLIALGIGYVGGRLLSR